MISSKKISINQINSSSLTPIVAFNAFTSSYRTGSFTGSFTGSLFGTSSYALNGLSSSFASTASFAPNYLPLTGGTISGSLTINNNLTVLGSASIQYISESTLNIGTNLITVNTINPGARFGGLSVIDSGSSPQVSASFLYDSIKDEFVFVHHSTPTTSSVFLQGPETYNDLGNEIYLTQNRIPKGTGIEHLNDSNISDNGLVVSINSNTQVTGSLQATNGISGSFSGSGADLFDIPASGIIGLNLSQISSGSVSASISPDNGLQVNTNVTATSFTGSLFGTASFAISSSQAVTASYALTGGDITERYTDTFTAIEGQTIFISTQPLVVGYYDVYLNGVRLNDTSYTVSTYTITLLDPCSLGDIVDIVSYQLVRIGSRDTRRNATDSTNENINYCGTAPAGSLENQNVWTIFKIVVATNGSVTRTFAVNVAWTDREIIIYT